MRRLNAAAVRAARPSVCDRRARFHISASNRQDLPRKQEGHDISSSSSNAVTIAKLDELSRELAALRRSSSNGKGDSGSNQQQQQPGGAMDTALGIALGTLLLGCGSVAYFSW